jgi:hypothetical protein
MMNSNKYTDEERYGMPIWRHNLLKMSKNWGIIMNFFFLSIYEWCKFSIFA